MYTNTIFHLVWIKEIVIVHCHDYQGVTSQNFKIKIRCTSVPEKFLSDIENCADPDEMSQN